MKLGMTGGIASGKSFIASLFEKKGCYVLDADEVSHKVILPNGEAYGAVVEHFGDAILAADGTIDRNELRKMVVISEEKLKKLESIIHPAVETYTSKWMGQVKGRDDKAIMIYHAPLLIESGQYKNFDATIVIWCSPEVQRKRLAKRGYPPYDDGVKLMQSQISVEEKIRYANFIIDNNTDEENAAAEVDRVYNLLRILQYTMKKKR